MASPLRLFRKYEYVFLVAFGIMLMIAFVVGPILSDYLDSRARSGHGENPVVVTWTGGELNESELNNLYSIHVVTTRFLRELTSQVEVTEESVLVDLRGKPVELIKGRRYPLNQIARAPVSGEIVYEIAVAGELVQIPFEAARMVSPKAEPITQAADEEDLVQRMILAQKARQQGVIVSEEAVLDYLDRLYDIPHDKRPDYAAMLKRSTGGRLDMRQFVGQMATELAAQRMRIMSLGGLLAVPPDVMYQCYNKLNRRVTAELLAVDVAGFLDQVGEPSPEDIAAVYEKGKDQFPFPTSPEPGFKRREKIAFGYLQAAYADFLKRETDQILPTITDAEIEDEYARNKDTQYTIPELPSEEPSAEQPPAGDPPATAAETSEAPASEADKVEPSGDSIPPSDAKTEPEGAAPSEPATPDTPQGEPSLPDTPQSDPPASETPDGQTPDGQAGLAGDAIVFVSYQQPAGPAAQPQEPAPQDPAPQDPAPQEPALDPPAQESPPAPAGDEPDPSEPAPSEPTQIEPAPPEESAGSDSAAAVEGEAAKEAPKTEEAPKKEVQYKPLDEQLRAEIRQRLASDRARAPAEQKLLKAVEEVEGRIENYARQLARSKALEGVEAPQPLDFAELAQAHDLVYLQTPLLDVLDVGQIFQMEATESDPAYYPFIRAQETTQSRDGRGLVRRTIIDLGFQGELELMVPRRLWDGMNMPETFPTPPNNLFVFWRREMVPEEVPALDEVRDEVVRAWKMKQALPLARDKAEELAKQAASEAGKSLAEVFPDSAANVIRTTPFSWMTRGALPSGSGGRPMVSPVNGMADNRGVNIAGAGHDFMESVFALDVGQVGTATDEPHAFVYVVRIESEDPSDEQRREAFFAGGYTQDIHSLVQEEQDKILRDWFESVEEEFGVDWKRDPKSISRVE